MEAELEDIDYQMRIDLDNENLNAPNENIKNKDIDELENALKG